MTGDDLKAWADRHMGRDGCVEPVVWVSKALGVNRKNAAAYLRRGQRALPKLVALATKGYVTEQAMKPEWDR